MKKWKRENSYGQETTTVLQPQTEGMPWKTTLKCNSFEEADVKRKLLKEKWAETKLVGAEVKVKQVRGEMYVVKIRVPEVRAVPEKNPETEKPDEAREKKVERRPRRNEKRNEKGDSRRAAQEAAWKKLRNNNDPA